MKLNYHYIKTEEKQKKNKQFFSRISFLDKLFFSKHLAMMLKSGITIAEAIETIADQTKSNKFQEILIDVSKSIRNGQTLARALSVHSKIFDAFYISLIEVGEASGTLDRSLSYLATHLANEYALRKKIQGALLYPMIVLTAVAVVGVGMSFFVLPNLVELFNSLDTDLPITTKILLYFANVMKEYGIFLIIDFFIFIFAFRILIALPGIKPIWHRILLSLPIFGELLQNGILTTIFRNLGMMLKSGLTITKALIIQYQGTENLVFKDYIKRLEIAVDKGKDMHSELTLGNYSKFSSIAIKMIGVGEKTGKLDETFIYLGDFFEGEVDNAAKNLSVVLEPIILLVIGIIVGFVALAIITPIYDLTASIKR